MDVTKIMNLLPHRYPFLLVDRVEAFTPGESMTALKNVTVNEPFFQGHFPGNPIMPGVLILEALAQTSGILEFATCEQTGESTDFLYVLASIDKAKFRRQVVPGDQLSLAVEMLSRKRNMAKVKGIASVDGKVVASAELMCA
ncbi:MAG TPA: 3-hydroxyacyl-ACP dehydratase FabZ, partial [Gammaproteobacteria bacterium]|nr:3-hydroxyacyl-ACP dehydratase FabZ [Gammaproteobacteria bacterium]